MKKDNIYVAISGFGIGFSIVFLISTAVYMIIAKDLQKVVTNQKYYIKELEWEVEQTEMICSEVENE